MELDQIFENGRRKLRPIVVRGAGDLATGTIWALSFAGYPVVALECSRPTAIRREAAFSEAVFLGEKTVEGLRCIRVDTAEEALEKARGGCPVLLIDETLSSLRILQPDILVDAIIAKRNLGTRMDLAKLVVALGPGFTAGKDAHAVIETMRGHNLGRILFEGSALPNTGVPGLIAGFGKERVVHAPAGGVLRCSHKIGDLVEKGEELGVILTHAEQSVEFNSAKAFPAAHSKGCNSAKTSPAAQGEENNTVKVLSPLSGVLRGILPEGFPVRKGMKMADVDPRAEQQENCYSISDKSRCIAGSVLLLADRFYRKTPETWFD